MSHGTNAKRISHYEILEQLGSGGMSIVFRARDSRSGEMVALKVLHPLLANRPDGQKRLAREAQVISQLDHPCIVRIRDYGHENSSEVFIVTELVDGVTLKEFGEKNSVWETPEVGALITRQIALALNYAHERQVIHRDIKPENIMISRDGSIKIMDFGIARLRDEGSLTMTGAMIGSPAHMAPELIEGKPSDPRSDIFSLSTLLYWLMAGVLPFDGTNPHTLLRNIIEGRVRSLEEVSAKVFPSLSAVVGRGLATAPHKRFQSASEMARAIDCALTPLGIDFESRLKALLADPEREIATLAQQIRTASLAQARNQVKAGRLPQGAVYLNRVLADDPHDTQALMLLDSHRTSRSPRWSVVAVSICAILALFAAVLGLPAQTPESPRQQQPETAYFQKPQIKATVVPMITTDAKPKDPPAAKEAPKTIVTVTPFADIWVDGEKVATNASRAELTLEPGEHKITFTHEFAATQERKLRVADKEQRIHVELEKVKPATLTIESNVDADVAIDGAYKGTSFESIKRPILVTFPKKAHSRRLEIVVSQKGFSPFISTLTVVPGTKQNIPVTLEPG